MDGSGTSVVSVIIQSTESKNLLLDTCSYSRDFSLASGMSFAHFRFGQRLNVSVVAVVAAFVYHYREPVTNSCIFSLKLNGMKYQRFLRR